MTAAVMSLTPDDRENAFRRSCDVIAAGGVIAYPTDTFYGLGADPRNAAAIRRLFAIKGRSEERPILLLIRDAAEVGRWAEGVSQKAQQLMRRHWPGPLTLVFAAKPDISADLTAGTGTIGLRMPGNSVTRLLLDAVGGSLTGTSANRSGSPEARTAAEVSAMLGDLVDLILDGGAAVADKPSTIVDVSGPRPRVIRHGAVEVDLA